MLEWLKAYTPAPKRVFVVHGESSVCDAFAAQIEAAVGSPATVPEYSGVWDLTADRELEHGTPLRPAVKKIVGVGDRTHSPNYLRLLTIQQRLASLVGNASGWANRDLAKITDQIASLCAKWEK
jgi:metallo-beta-lactamase family protein